MRHASVLALSVPLSFVSAQQTHAVLDAPVIAVDAWSRIDELCDLDLDGDLDGFGIYFNQVTMSTNPSFLQAKLHRNDGNGRFTSTVLYQWQTTGGNEPTQYRSAVGDVDGDHHPDVVTMRGGELWVVESRAGQPTVRTLTSWPLGVSVFALNGGAQMCDLNDDGRAELITMDTSDGVRAFTLNATTFQRRCIGSAVSGTEVVVIDANGDGVHEAVVIDGGMLRFLPIEQLGYIAPFGSLTLPLGVGGYGGSGRLAAGDVDNDGDVDLIVFDASGLYARVENVGAGQFVVHPAATGGPANYLHDVDGDGDLDGTCCGGGGGSTLTTPNHTLGNFQVAENLGGGVFATAWRMPTIGTFHLAGCADMDGDGRKDLVGGRCVWFQRGRMNPVANVLETAGLTRVGDVDRDGDPDVFGPGGTQWTNRGDGVFGAAPTVLPTPPAGCTWAVRAGPIDFDQDGDLDVLADALLLGTPVTTHLLRNRGGGLLVDAGAVTPNGTTLGDTEALFAADVDGDGDTDVLAGDAVPTGRLWLQTGGALVLGKTWVGQRIVGVGEFTGDGRADVLVATNPYSPGTFNYMYLSMQSCPATGTWVQQPIGAIVTALDAPGIVDHDGDGDLDVLLNDWLGASNTWVIRAWTNGGSGQFSVGPVLGDVLLASRARIATADVDGDGRYDVVAGPLGYYDALPNSNTGVHVLLQTTPQQFTSVAYSSQFGWPADADGDGDVDLIGRAVLHNARFHGAAAGEREQFGQALAGTGGGKPVLGATGPVRVGSTLTTTLTGGCGQEVAMFVASFLRADPPQQLVPGFTFYLDSPLILGAIVLDGGSGVAGEGTASFSLPIFPFAAGLDFYQQAIVSDPAGVAPGVTHTNALRVRVGW